MSIGKIKLDEKSILEFGVSITGADGRPDARFVIDGADFSVSFPCKQTNEGVEVEIQGLKDIFKAGTYDARLEIVLENKIYTPLIDKIEFEPSIQIYTQAKPAVQVKESVKVANITVKKSAINEDQLRKTQAATIIANALGYNPNKKESAAEIVNHAIAQAGPLTTEQAATVKEMLALAEACGIMYNGDFEFEIISEEVLPELAPIVIDDDGFSDETLDEMANCVTDWEDIVDTYEAGELALIDEDTGEVIDTLEEELSEETLNEVLSRIERIRAKIRFRKSESKRERKIKVALHQHSNSSKINSRARHLAIKTMKMKLAKKPLDQLSTAEKERIENIMHKRKKAVDRLALKMTSRVRKIEKDRLSTSHTQEAK
jgi:hypothetical protein